ncbi:MAG: NAD(P)-dependent oxidoreductase [Geminicoccaceae bacterium]|nr:MAG: NAD(P)-dependent oxidoreductase [Geminicoccaceae bacterium]
MGAAMARTLAGKGVAVVGYDVAEAARNAAAVPVVADLAELWPRTRTVVLSLPLPEHVEAVMASLLAAHAPPTLVIDTSTSDPDVTVRLGQALDAQGHALVDAPVSGGPAGAAAGTLAIMVGGSEQAVSAARPTLDHLAAKIAHVGPLGAGHTAKLVNNVLCAAHILLAGEALRMGAAAGTPIPALTDALNGSSGRSGVTEVNVPRWITSATFDSGFTMALMAKDLSLAARLADRTGLALPLIDHVVRRWQELTQVHGGDADFNRAFLGEEKG